MCMWKCVGECVCVYRLEHTLQAMVLFCNHIFKASNSGPQGGQQEHFLSGPFANQNFVFCLFTYTLLV